ncbi:hypothetical protein ACFL1L_02275 [Thermoplasmatota archaeon]
MIRLPRIIFVEDYVERTLTVKSIMPSNFSWDFIEIIGNCNSSALGENVTIGDKITSCYGIIRIIHNPSNIVLWEFDFD